MLKQALISLLTLALIIGLLGSSLALAASNASQIIEGTGVGEVLSKMLTNTKVLVAVTIQFLLGLGLGYYSAKVLKYVLALIAIVIIGAVLSVWSIGGSVDEFVRKLGTQAQYALPLIKSFMATLGILTVGPITVGFLLGLLIAFMRK